MNLKKPDIAVIGGKFYPVCAVTVEQNYSRNVSPGSDRVQADPIVGEFQTDRPIDVGWIKPDYNMLLLIDDMNMRISRISDISVTVTPEQHKQWSVEFSALDIHVEPR